MSVGLSGSVMGVDVGRLSLENAKRAAMAGEARARSLERQASEARSIADSASAKADSAEMEASRARLSADSVARNVRAAQGFAELSDSLSRASSRLSAGTAPTFFGPDGKPDGNQTPPGAIISDVA